MKKTDLTPISELVRRKSIVMKANVNRVITRPYIPHGEARVQDIINRVLGLDEDQVVSLFDTTMHNFSHRHRNFRNILEGNFERVSAYVPSVDKLSKERRLLIGAYFTAEYSVEAAALFNPSIVKVASQEADSEGSCRFVMSFRATGEGHISSIEFRGGIIDANGDFFFDALSNYIATPETRSNPRYNRLLFQMKLQEMGANDKVVRWLLDELPKQFPQDDLLEKLEGLRDVGNLRRQDKKAATEMVMWLVQSNYEILFPKDHPISERVIFPVSTTESQGIEDARFVRFVDDDGTVTYYATYTAFNGDRILPQLIKTTDFLAFKVMTMYGAQAHGKGMALFPRKIGGKFAMLSRQDGAHCSIMFSDTLHYWEQASILQEPEFPYEFFQMGNSGSPIETSEGWLVVTHGVGPMRTYSLGIELLDLEDPTRIVSRIEHPILQPNPQEREGYVPNVVYSCGAIIHQNELIIPYAYADHSCTIATLSLSEVMTRLMQRTRPTS
ncbi:MAG: glycoside hydrolase family 130 protein [Acidiferrobacterales bacterium]